MQLEMVNSFLEYDTFFNITNENLRIKGPPNKKKYFIVLLILIYFILNIKILVKYLKNF